MILDIIFFGLFGVLFAYVALGIIFGALFLFFWFDKVDTAAHGASFLVRLLWLPGAVILWPILIIKVIKYYS